MEIKEYFILCEEQMPQRCTELRRTSFALRRNGVDTMEELCRLWHDDANQLAQLRDIGAKSFALIGEICEGYWLENR
ncbi:MAG: hypothetical protein RR336_04355 [Oscillospiraceae bacterium]